MNDPIKQRCNTHAKRKLNVKIKNMAKQGIPWQVFERERKERLKAFRRKYPFAPLPLSLRS